MIQPLIQPQGCALNRQVETHLGRNYDIRVVDNILDQGLEALAEKLRSRSALCVSSRRVHDLYGRTLHLRLKEMGIDIPMLVIDCGEHVKTTEQVVRVCEEAKAHNLDRQAVLVAFGGGVCTDIVTVAASWIRRGIKYICVPTTLIGQVDAGIGIKGAVNFHGKKSYIGAFYPPDSVLIDPSFLRTLPERYISCGMAEIIKIAIVRDDLLFDLVERNSGSLLISGFSSPAAESREILWRSAVRMAEELETNIYEDKTYKRLVDFGHTFSPSLESASGFRIHHGEAVAIDMALTCAIACELGFLSKANRDRVISALVSAKLPIYSPLLTEHMCMSAFEDTMRHRGGAVNLVVPTEIGRATFIEQSEEVSIPALKSALRWLAHETRQTTAVAALSAGCLVFDVGGTSLRAALYHEGSDSLSRVVSRKTPNCFDTHEKDMGGVVKELLDVMHLMGVELLGHKDPDTVSVAFPGPIDGNGHVVAAPTVWGSLQQEPIDLAKLLRERWPLAHVAVLNDVSASGYRYIREDSRDFCIVTVSSGIGNKVFINGRPVTGLAGRGGEIGHIKVDSSPDAPMCDCGFRGHLGAISSGRGTLFLARQKAQQNPKAYLLSALGKRYGTKFGMISNRTIAEVFRLGDPWAAELIRTVAQPLGQMLASIHLAVGIERFVIVGGFAQALGEQYRGELVSAAASCGWVKGENWDAMIEVGFPDGNSGLIGAGRFGTRYDKS